MLTESTWSSNCSERKTFLFGKKAGAGLSKVTVLCFFACCNIYPEKLCMKKLMQPTLTEL